MTLNAPHPLMMPSIVLTTLLYTLDSTIAAVALPQMQGAFSSTQEQVAWVITSYILMSAIMTPMAGYLADRFGRKRIFLIAIIGFTVTSMLCGLAYSLEEMVIYRLLQGAFGAAFVPLAQTTLLDSFSPEKFGSAMALFGMGVMLGPVIGPTIGAWLTEYYSWRWVFFINLPLGILAFIGISWSTSKHNLSINKRPFDLAGFIFLALAIGAFQLMMARGNSLSWFQSTEITLEALVCGLSLYLFVVRIKTSDQPFINPVIFRNQNFTACTILGFAIGFNMMATMLLLPPLLQNLLGYPVLDTGWILAPRGLGTMLSFLLVGRLVSRFDPRLLISIGLSLSALSVWQMSLFDRNVNFDEIAISGFIQGFGMGLMFVPLSTLAFATLAPEFRNQASGIFNLVRYIGSSVGASLLTGLLVVYYKTNREHLVTHINIFNPNLNTPEVLAHADPTTLEGLMVLDNIVNQEALMIGYNNDFRVMMLIAILSMPMLLLLKPGALVAKNS